MYKRMDRRNSDVIDKSMFDTKLQGCQIWTDHVTDCTDTFQSLIYLFKMTVNINKFEQ